MPYCHEYHCQKLKDEEEDELEYVPPASTPNGILGIKTQKIMVSCIWYSPVCVVFLSIFGSIRPSQRNLLCLFLARSPVYASIFTATKMTSTFLFPEA